MKRSFCLLAGFLALTAGLMLTAHAQALQYGAWLPYWEPDAALAEMETLADRLDEVIAFAALFDTADQPLMLPETETLLKDLQKAYHGTDTTVFLSIVNDLQTGDGQYDNKSTALLSRLFASDDAISRHLEALVQLVDDYSLAGLELDYENLKSDAQLWQQYVNFLQRVWAYCARDGLRLRVVLPWDAPKYAQLPQGPEYSVMCYNLYGTHSGPGPKADIAFLQQTCALYQPLGAGVRMAFATGGFDWHGDQITDLTQEEAADQLLLAGTEPTRDADSGAMTATYVADGETHVIWYADAQTLALWRDTCMENGFTAFDLFRLGGNDLADWDDALLGTHP